MHDSPGISADEQRAVVAAFDVDGTLTTRDTVVPFLRRFLTPRTLRRAIADSPTATRALVRRDRDALKEAATRAAFAGVPVERVRREASRHAHRIHDDWLRADTFDQLNQHRHHGHRVVLVSAGYECYLRPLGERLGVHGVLATQLETMTGSAGERLLTGNLVGANCRRGEKVRRLEEWCASTGLTARGIELWAYGDSDGDRELLAAADHPCWVTATRRAQR